MKLAGFLGFLVVVVPLGLAAQNGGASFSIAGESNGATGTITTIGPNGQTVTRSFTVPNPCPISMQASHLSDGSMIKTGSAHPKGVHPAGLGQRLHLTLTSPDERTIASAVVNVRGWTATGRMERAAFSHGQGLSMRTLTVLLTAGTNRSASTDLWAPGLTAVDSVELYSVTFTDGTNWYPDGGRACRVTPDPMMLVANR